MKRVLLRAKNRHIKEYEIFLNKLLSNVTTKIKKTDNNKIYFKDGEDDIIGFDVEEVLLFLNSFFRKVHVDVEDSLGKFDAKQVKTFSLIIEENVQLIASLLLDHKKNLTRIITDGVESGKTITALAEEISTGLNISSARAETIAITETSKANSKFSIRRLDELGIKDAIWSSSKDKRTRKCHNARGGKIYELEKGCYSPCDGKFIQVGFEIRCRCATVIYL